VTKFPNFGTPLVEKRMFAKETSNATEFRKSKLSIMERLKSALRRSNPDRFTPRRSASKKRTRTRVVPEKLLFASKRAPEKFTPVRSSPEKFAPRRSLPVKFTPLR